MSYQVPPNRRRLWPMILRVVCILILVSVPNLITFSYGINDYIRASQHGTSFGDYLQMYPEIGYIVPLILVSMLFLVAITQDIRQSLRGKQPPWTLYAIGSVLVIIGLCYWGLLAVSSITHV